MAPEIALAASARDWPDRLHRFILDHGGGRIVDRVMGPDQATAGSFDVLLIDDVCSFLTPRLVMVLKQSSVEVIGVYMPEDGSDAKRRLLECGISDVIETDASPEEFLAKIKGAMAHRAIIPAPEPSPETSALRIGVTGPCEGVGMTEIAIALARSVADELPTVLIDLDPQWPSVAQRLHLPLHPNIRTALDNALHSFDRLEEAIHRVEDLMVIGGRADGGHGAEISRAEMSMLIDAMAGLTEVVVADLGPLDQTDWSLMRECDTLILVGSGDPVGVARLIRATSGVLARDPAQSMLVVVNKTGKGPYFRAEILDALNRFAPEVPVATIPFDERLEQAMWNGEPVVRGKYLRAVEAMSNLVVRSLM